MHNYQEERKTTQRRLIKRDYKPTSIEKSLAKVDTKEKETQTIDKEQQQNPINTHLP